MAKVINLVSSECGDVFMKRLINKNFGELLDNDLEPYTYPLEDAEYTGQILFEDLVSFIYTDQYSGIYTKYTEEQISGFVRSCGVTPQGIVDWVTNWLSNNRVNKSIRMAFMSEPKTNEPKKINDKKRKMYLKKLDSFNRQIHQITYQEAMEEFEKGNSNVWAVRSQFGDVDCLFYKIEGEKEDKDNYVVRYQYAVDTLCNYYQVREISYKGWMELDDEHKFATQP